MMDLSTVLSINTLALMIVSIFGNWINEQVQAITMPSDPAAPPKVANANFTLIHGLTDVPSKPLNDSQTYNWSKHVATIKKTATILSVITWPLLILAFTSFIIITLARTFPQFLPDTIIGNSRLLIWVSGLCLFVVIFVTTFILVRLCPLDHVLGDFPQGIEQTFNTCQPFNIYKRDELTFVGVGTSKLHIQYYKQPGFAWYTAVASFLLFIAANYTYKNPDYSSWRDAARRIGQKFQIAKR